jgi:TonB family protein
MAEKKPAGVGASSNAPRKILRIGVIQAGRIVEERLVREQTNVTVGASPRNTICVPASSFPRSVTLFERKGEHYSLKLPPGVRGRVAVGDRILALEDIDQKALPLSEASRGKVQLGETALLFQFVTPPPIQPQPQLPPSVRGGFWANLDWTLAACFAAMIAVHGGLVAYMSGLDRPREVKVDLIPEFIPELRQPIVLDVRGLIEKGEPPIEKIEKIEKTKPERVNGGSSSKGRKGGVKGHGKRRPRICDAECLRKKVSQMGVIMLLGDKSREGKGLARDLLRSGDPGTEAAKAFRNLGGVKIADRKPGGGLKLKDGSGPHRPGDVDIDDLGPRGPKRVDIGGPVKERVPKELEVRRLPPKTTHCDPDAVAAVIRRGMHAVKACYQRGIKKNPNLQGKLTVRLTINTMGRVTQVEIDDALGDPGVASCTKRRARYWRFPPPRDGTAEVSVPFVFRATSR